MAVAHHDWSCPCSGKMTSTEVERMFREWAEKILNGSLLEIGGRHLASVGDNPRLYRICEIEFYYCASSSPDDEHKDLYTHCDDLQLEYGRFYPHRINGKGFKGGTFKCMDITYGDRDKGIYFGILIRSIRNIATGEFFTGPCVSVNEILKNFTKPGSSDRVKEWRELEALSKTGENTVTFVNYEFRLIDASIPALDIFVGPRVGLSDKYPDYQDREYRYATDIKSIKKQKSFFRQLV